MIHPRTDAVVERALAHFDATVAQLTEFLTIPAISCKAAHRPDVVRMAEKVKATLTDLGFEAAIHELDGALPLVAAHWLEAGPDKPTVLIYGHFDLQPVDEPEWIGDPHRAVERDGRLYARGSADDMGGWVGHIAALRAWFAETGSLPCNVRLLIEGEEEIGSPNLERYMDAFPEAFAADVMVLTDCENPSVQTPGLTVSLRGLMEVELVVEALGGDVHSGLFGNMLPDVSTALCKIIGRLVDADGRPHASLLADVPVEWSADAGGLVDPDLLRTGGALLEGLDLLPERGRPAAEWLWRQPAITVVATTLPRPQDKKNALRARATATLSVRLGPGQTAPWMTERLRGLACTNPPGGVRVSLNANKEGESWLYTPRGPAFEAADRAYEAAWGQKLARVGLGGSIPFVAMFGRRFSDLPLILNGVLDPESSAHGPNESMDLGVFRKAIHANVRLLAELAALEKGSLRG